MLLAVLMLSVVPLQAEQKDAMDKPFTATIKNAQEYADFSRLPRFYTSDAAYDEFVNDYFMRHLSVDDRAVYTGGVVLGIVDHMWVIEWDQFMLPWIDRGAMGLRRQGNATNDAILETLANAAVDKYGYTWGARLCPEPNNSLGGYKPTFGWCWPKYNRNTTVTRPTGWDFNDPNDRSKDEWTARDISLEPEYVDNCLVGTISGDHPELITPKFDTDVFQVPIIEIDIDYRSASGRPVNRLVDGLKVYWTTDTSPRFSEERMVTVDFADLPPKDFPADYAAYGSESSARYPLYFPMCLHPEWGREGRRITRLKIVPTGPGAEGVRISLNYVRASYDVRLTTTNTTLINASYRFYMWTGDDVYLKAVMPKLRKAMVFLNEHLKGRQDGLLNFDWFVGKDGFGGNSPGHGVHGSYWDLLPSGRYDIESSIAYYDALRSMAELERVVRKKGWDLPRPGVIGPDNRTPIAYRETPQTLHALAARVKRNIEQRFWVKETGRFCRNIDSNGKQHDYGFLHFNVLALAMGLGTPAQRDSILSWLDGRVVPGDTSTGEDIYHYRFGPRTSTRRNDSYYYWAWIWERERDPQNPIFTWGNQMQDGGAVPFTSLFELMARTGSLRQEQVDKAFQRTREIRKWYLDVKSAGGKGTEFYRTYYKDHPERGMMQSPTPGGIGLDHEFLSDSSLGTLFLLHAFLRVDAPEDGVLSVSPLLPTGQDKIGVTNVFYRGNHINIEAGRGYVSLEGSRIPVGDGLKARVTIANVPKGCRLYAGESVCKDCKANSDGSVTVVTDLKPVRIEARAQ